MVVPWFMITNNIHGKISIGYLLLFLHLNLRMTMKNHIEVNDCKISYFTFCSKHISLIRFKLSGDLPKVGFYLYMSGLDLIPRVTGYIKLFKLLSASITGLYV